MVARAAVHEFAAAERVPVFVELKSYRGSLQELIRTSASADVLDSSAVRRAYILDGADEVPAELQTAFAKH